MNVKSLFTNFRLWVILFGVLISIFFIATSGYMTNRDDSMPLYRGRVLDVDDSRLQPDPSITNLHIGRQTLEVELLEGIFAGQRFRIDSTLSRFFNVHARAGMEILLFVDSFEGMVNSVEVFGHSRSTFLIIFLILFAVILIAVGRSKGFYSMLSLLFTLIVIVFFMLPNIIDGSNPVILAVIVAVFTAVFSIFLVADFSKKSFAATLGTIIGVTIAGVTGIIAGEFSFISGMNMEHASEVFHQGGRYIQIRVPLLFSAAIIIASLGAMIDVAMSITSAVFEVKKVNESLSFWNLYKSGMRIGRDIIGTMSNTLILAFAGSSIMVLIIIALYELPYIRLMNMDMLAVEVILGISASIGLVLTVPVTSFLAAWLASERNINLNLISPRRKT